MAAEEAQATIVIVPRERFGMAVASLESVLRNTSGPFSLVYVDAGSPPQVEAEITRRVRDAGGRMIRVNHTLPPNTARNLALPHLRTRYVAFVDNDVLVEAGWLSALVGCAERTGAAQIGPLTMMQVTDTTVVHLAGGELVLEEEDGHRRLTERHLHINEPAAGIQDRLSTKECEFAEFHATLLRRDVLDELGPFDEGCLSTAEHLDLSMLLRQAGHRVYVEPQAMVTYVAPGTLTLSERHYFMERWSDSWNRSSFDHFARKWDLDRNSPFFTSNQSFLYNHQAVCPLPMPAPTGAPEAASICDHGYAQTPAQLYGQMRAEGWPEEAVRRVRAASECANVLFSDLVRACGKPFHCHGIGTASILLRYRAPLALIVAGLCHAAYSHGRFPARRRPSSHRRRAWLRARIGWGAESLVQRFHKVAWGAGPPEEALNDLDCRDAGVYLLRMANDIEERLDLALAQTDKPAIELPEWQPFFQRLTEALGVPALALELRESMTATAGIARAEGSGRTSAYAVESWGRRPEPFERRKKLTRSWWRRRLGSLLSPRPRS